MSQPTKFVKIITPLAFAIALASCGGGGSETFGGGGSDGGASPTIVASSLELKASSRQLQSDGLNPVVITAIAKDENNNAIADAEIIFAVDNGATINIEAASGGGTTSGAIKTANLTPSAPENRTLKVTATSGDETKTILVDVVGTTVVIDGPSSITFNKAVPYVLKLNDSANRPIAFESVELISSAGNTIESTDSFQTDAAGNIAFTLTGVAGGEDVLSAKVLGVEYVKNISVSADEFVLSSSSEEIVINNPTSISFLWSIEGVVQEEKVINITATRGIITLPIPNEPLETDANGVAKFTISSTTAGKTVITATSVAGLSTSLEREFIATVPAYLNTQADPTLIAPNASSTIVAKVRDSNDNPVKNKIINFRLSDTVNGSLSASTAITDSLGRASVSYTAGNSSSGKDGVVIDTSIQGYPLILEDPIKLTVGGNAVRIILGTDHLLTPDGVFYEKTFGVIATDSAGNPVKNQRISFKIIPSYYYKGTLVYSAVAKEWLWFSTAQGGGVTAKCINEDYFDNDGNLDAGEDVNGSGFLEPSHDATVTGSGVTDENGRIRVEVIYPRSSALWTDQVIEATTIVEGTEYIERTEFQLPVAADDVRLEGSPPNQFSPYGIWGGCTDDPNALAPTQPVVTSVVAVEPLSGLTTQALGHDVWYSIAVNNQIAGSSSYTISSSAVTIISGPNNTFKLRDNNTAVDNSGYFINVTFNGISTPLYYSDDAPIIVPPPTPPTPDGNPPILTLNGLAFMSVPVDLTLGAVFVDPGANAVDAIDGVIGVVVQGFVNIAVEGTYTLIYTATDSDGNSVSYTREVTVTP